MKRITERLEAVLSGTEVDAAAGIVRNVSLLGLDSKNGYRYSESAARKAVADGLYDDAHIYADHLPEGKSGPRGVPELVGKVLKHAAEAASPASPRYDESRKRVVADIKIITKSPLGPMFLEMASDPELSKSVGMSHDCDGELNESTKTVTSISRVHSVDFVTRPATTGGIHEGIKEQDMDELKELREQLDALKKEREAEAKALKEAQDKADAAAKEAAALKEATAKRDTLALVESESEGLPDKVRAKLREQFKDRAEKPEVVKQAVADMREICESVGARDDRGTPIMAVRYAEQSAAPGEDSKLLREAFGYAFGNLAVAAK